MDNEVEITIHKAADLYVQGIEERAGVPFADPVLRGALWDAYVTGARLMYLAFTKPKVPPTVEGVN